MPEIVVFLIGLLAALRGAEWLGSASIKLAKRLEISQFVIGATIVSVATTLPEISVSIVSGILDKNSTVALGTIVGSPIINLGLCLGLLFFFSKARLSIGYYSRSVNVLFVVSLLLFVTSFYRPFGSLLSLFLIVLGILFIGLELVISRHSLTMPEKIFNRFEDFLNIFHGSNNLSIFLELFFGTILLLIGSKYLVDSVVNIANSFNLNPLFISAIFLALGTSVPEIINTASSIIHKREALAIGNLVGASVLDLTLGLGLGTFTTESKVSYPINIILFLPLVIISALCLSALVKNIPLRIIGALLLATSFAFLAVFSLQQFMNL